MRLAQIKFEFEDLVMVVQIIQLHNSCAKLDVLVPRTIKQHADKIIHLFNFIPFLTEPVKPQFD